MEGYEGPNDMEAENAKSRTMFRRSPYAPYQGYEMEEDMVGKDA